MSVILLNHFIQKILPVDDDHDLLFVVQQMLKKQGYEVATHPYGKDIFKALAYVKADLVVLDINLGDADGRMICSKIKSIPEFQYIPIILYSGEQHPDLHIADCKAEALFFKPFKMESFLQKINELLGSSCTAVTY